MSDATNDGWDDDDRDSGSPLGGWRKLSADEAAALRIREPVVSPWRVVAVQVLTGLVVAAAAGGIFGSAAAMSALYGAAIVVVPGALMARGMTSRLSAMSPMVSAVSFMSWEFVKIAVSLAMLIFAGRIVQHLVWPALLAALVLCIKVYWVALLWRRHPQRV